MSDRPSVLRTAKNLARRMAPSTYDRARLTYGRWRPGTLRERRELGARTKRFAAVIDRLGAATGWRVPSGPFAGLRYPDTLARRQRGGYLLGSTIAPKLAGSYEAELHPAFAEIARTRYATAINIGTGEGYYAVGLARLLSEAAIHGFDIDRRARRFCMDLAALNGVESRVTIHGAVDPRRLTSALPQSGRCLIVCDCEGCERVLLDPAEVPTLARADIVVELHEFLVPGITTLMKQRFAATHQVEIVLEQPRDPTAFPALASFDTPDRKLALDEGRPDRMSWAVMLARTSAPGERSGAKGPPRVSQ